MLSLCLLPEVQLRVRLPSKYLHPTLSESSVRVLGFTVSVNNLMAQSQTAAHNSFFLLCYHLEP